MLKKIRDVPVIKKIEPFQVQLDSDLKSKVERNWEEYLQKMVDIGMEIYYLLLILTSMPIYLK